MRFQKQKEESRSKGSSVIVDGVDFDAVFYHLDCIFLFKDYVETSVAVGQTAKLRLNQTLVAPESDLMCLSIRLRHIIAIEPESVKSGALLQLIVPELSIHFRPTIGPSLVIPVETVADGRWILMQMTISGIQTPYDIIFQQGGPMTISAAPVTIPAAIQLALEKLTLKNGEC